MLLFIVVVCLGRVLSYNPEGTNDLVNAASILLQWWRLGHLMVNVLDNEKSSPLSFDSQ